jgi:hypothetical protein
MGSIMTRLWKVEGKKLLEVAATQPQTESIVEEWISRDPSIIGLNLLIIACQWPTDFGGRIDLLGIDEAGDLTLIEIKRDKTPREAIAQALDYGSWVNGLSTSRIHSIARDYLHRPLSEAFREKFGQNIPETLNSSHNLLIVASGLDPSSKRIVEYLAETHNVSINTAFFTYFRDQDVEYLAADWLLDQREVVERSEDKRKAPWTGYYYVNVGHDPDNRIWDDMRQFGFVAAGYGRIYSGRLEQLSPGDKIFAYQKGSGYVGYGVVTSAAVMAKEFLTRDGKKLGETDLRQPNILHHADDPEMADYVVGVDWKKTFSLDEAKWLPGGFANQNVVCKLRHQATLDFLIREFEVEKLGQV